MGLNPADQVESFGEVYRLPSSRGLSAVSSPVFRNFARNSPATRSKPEIASLELQCFKAVLKSYRFKLRAELRLGGVERVLQENRCNCPERVRGQCRQLGLSTGWGNPSIGGCAISPMRVEAVPWGQVDAVRRRGKWGGTAWSTWRCCAASTSAARIKSS